MLENTARNWNIKLLSAERVKSTEICNIEYLQMFVR